MNKKMINAFFLAMFLGPVMLLRYLLHIFVIVLAFCIPRAKARFEFELKNKTSSIEIPDAINIHALFEISSEGEWEQVAPLIYRYIQHSMAIQILYSSPALDKKMQELQQDYKNIIFVWRLPIVSAFFLDYFLGQNIFNWVKCKKVFLCRYDFYPELFLLKVFKGATLYLCSATLKNKTLKGVKKLYYTFLYAQFDFFTCSTQEDKKKLISLGIKESSIAILDLRIEQILYRQKKQQKVLAGIIGKKCFNFVAQIAKNQRVIAGSVWPSELDIFFKGAFQKELVEGTKKLVLVPHLLDDENINIFHRKAKENGLVLSEINSLQDSTFEINAAQVLLVNAKGFLCELYPHFGYAYIGGGFGRSVHSILEPFLAGCIVVCGPKIHRSTEFEWALSINNNKVLSLGSKKLIANFLTRENKIKTKHKMDLLNERDNDLIMQQVKLEIAKNREIFFKKVFK